MLENLLKSTIYRIGCWCNIHRIKWHPIDVNRCIQTGTCENCGKAFRQEAHDYGRSDICKRCRKRAPIRSFGLRGLIDSKRKDKKGHSDLDNELSAWGGMFLISVIFVLIHLIGLPGVLDNIAMASESVDWPRTMGVVVSSEVESRAGYDTTDWHARVSYRYATDGNSYLSRRITFGDIGSSRNTAMSLVDKYSVGKSVSVYYNPESPDISVLEPGDPPISHIFLMVLFTVGALFSFAKLWSG